MQKETVEIKSKGKVLESASYAYPDNIKEAINTDGEEKVYKLYAMQRKIRFADARRRALTGAGISTAMTRAIKKADPNKIAKILALLGDDADDSLKATVAAMQKVAGA